MDPAVINRLIDLAIAIVIVSALILFAGIAWEAISSAAHRWVGRDNLMMRSRIRRYGNGRRPA